MRWLARLGLLIGAVAALATPAAAQSWPTKPVKIVVPFGPGGPADVYARILGQELTEVLKQQFVIDNKPGAGAVIGTDVVAKAAPDGYTLLMMSNTHTTNETLLDNKPYVLMRDLIAVAPVNSSDLVMVVHPSVKAKTLQEFIALAKAEPGKLTYASSGPGTPYHMAGELFKAMSGTDILHVPHKGSAEARNDVMGGHVQMMFDAVTAMKGNIDAGQVRALATTGEKRSTVLPDVPTVSEAGVPGYEATIWLGIMAPKGTPPGDRRPAERRDRQDHRQACDPRGLGQAGRRPHDHVAGPVRRLPAARHRQVGQGDPAGRHQGAMKIVRILSGGAAQGLVEALQPAFEASTGCRIDGVFGAVGAMKGRLLAGEPVDIMILSRALIDGLARDGHVVASVGEGYRRRADRRRGAKRRSRARGRQRRRTARGPARQRRDSLPRSRAIDRRHPLRQGVARSRRPRRPRRPAAAGSQRRHGHARARRVEEPAANRLYAGHRDHRHARHRAGGGPAAGLRPGDGL